VFCYGTSCKVFNIEEDNTQVGQQEVSGTVVVRQTLVHLGQGNLQLGEGIEFEWQEESRQVVQQCK
jgi:hypothetical protein